MACRKIDRDRGNRPRIGSVSCDDSNDSSVAYVSGLVGTAAACGSVATLVDQRNRETPLGEVRASMRSRSGRPSSMVGHATSQTLSAISWRCHEGVGQPTA